MTEQTELRGRLSAILHTAREFLLRGAPVDKLEGESLRALLSVDDKTALHACVEERQRWRAARLDAGRVLTALFGWASLVLALWSPWLPWLLDSSGKVWYRVMAFLAACTATYMFMRWRKKCESALSLRLLDARAYAEVSIGNQHPEVILLTIARHIRAVCDQFLHCDVPQALWELADQTRQDREDRAAGGVVRSVLDDEVPANELKIRLSRHAGAVRSAASALDAVLDSQMLQLECLQSMVELGAEELDLSVRSLSDYVFQFRPDMYERRARKFARNWIELLEFASLKGVITPQARSRMIGLLIQNRRIRKKMERGREYQVQLEDHSLTLRDVLAYSTTNSTTAAVRHYAEVVSKETARCFKKLADPGIEGATDLRRALTFQFYKQRAHAGYQVHALCENMFDRSLSGNLRRFGEKESAEKMLRALKLIGKVSAEQRYPDGRELSEVLDELRPLQYLRKEVMNILDIGRWQVVKRFEELVRHWFVQSKNRLSGVIVVHGYSKTIRDALRIGVRPILASQQSPELRIVVLQGSANDESGAHDMVYELKQDLPNNSKPILVHNHEFIEGLLDSTTRVLVVVGAECFDEERRVLHPRAGQGALKWLARASQTKAFPYLVVAVAEGYKFRPDLSLDASAFRDHLDQVQLLPAGAVDLVLGDDLVVDRKGGKTLGWIPARWKSVCKHCSQRGQGESP